MPGYDLRVTLQQMLAFAEKVERDVALGRDAFDTDEHVRVFIEHHVMLLGEATNRVRKALQAIEPAIPWPDVVGLRNAIIHGYDRVNRDKVWQAASEDVPVLRQAVERLLAQLPE